MILEVDGGGGGVVVVGEDYSLAAPSYGADAGSLVLVVVSDDDDPLRPDHLGAVDAQCYYLIADDDGAAAAADVALVAGAISMIEGRLSGIVVVRA